MVLIFPSLCTGNFWKIISTKWKMTIVVCFFSPTLFWETPFLSKRININNFGFAKQKNKNKNKMKNNSPNLFSLSQTVLLASNVVILLFQCCHMTSAAWFIFIIIMPYCWGRNGSTPPVHNVPCLWHVLSLAFSTAVLNRLFLDLLYFFLAACAFKFPSDFN